MSELIYGLVGQRVALISTDGVMWATDEGVLDAYDGRVVRLRKDDERLYFPIANVHSIANVADHDGSGPPARADTGATLLSELVGQEVHIFPNPHNKRIDGVLETVDDQFVRLTWADSHDGSERWLVQPLNRIRLIKPATK